jgi:hypothetical protein
MNANDKKKAHSLAVSRASDALRLIEDAQCKLLEATQMLSPIVGAVPEWRATAKLYDRVKQHWYRLDAKTRKLGTRLCVDERFLEHCKTYGGLS